MYEGILEAGRSIADAIDWYRERHEQASKLDETVNFLATHVDPNTKKPYIPKDAFERASALAGTHKMLAEQGILDGMKYAQLIHRAGIEDAYVAAQSDYYRRKAGEDPRSG
jgi:hypothetical protein